MAGTKSVGQCHRLFRSGRRHLLPQRSARNHSPQFGSKPRLEPSSILPNPSYVRTIRPWLHVGSYRDTTNLHLLEVSGIQMMLQMAEDVRYPQIESLFIPVADGVPLPLELFERGKQFILQAICNHRTLLIACGAGLSRSVVFATAALKEAEGLGLLEAYQELKARHPEALAHPRLWNSLCGFYGESVPYRQILRRKA